MVTSARSFRAAAWAVAAIAVAPASALAQGELTFRFEGRGFGHGVGMSQYGARGMAANGWSHARILAHYYRGTQLEQRPPATVRVLINEGVPAVTVRSVGGPGTVTPQPGGADVPLQADAEYTVRFVGGSAQVEDAASGAVVAASPVGIRITGPAVQAGRRSFRGTIELTPTAEGLRTINRIDSEQYLQGVVTGEMPASWGDTPEALNAQAVAARTYVLTHLRSDRAFDVYSDTRSQVYNGITGETPQALQAVADTRGEVVTYDGQMIATFYSSTSGGRTENVEQSVLGGPPRPYLVAVDDPFDNISPYHRWSRPPTFTASALATRLRLAAPVSAVEVTARGASPRVRTVNVTTTDGVVTTLTGPTVRARLDLPDTWFWVVRSDQPDPGEPGATPPPTTPAKPPAPTTPTPPPAVSQVVRRGRWMVVAARSPRRAEAVAAAARLKKARPHLVVFRRGTPRRPTYVVATGRYALLPDAMRERARLRRLRFPARVIEAVTGDPVVRTIGATRAAPVVAPSIQRYRVVVATRDTRAAATAVAGRLRGHTPAPRVVSEWNAVTGTRFVVLTHTAASDAVARAEVIRLHEAGFPEALRQPRNAPSRPT